MFETEAGFAETKMLIKCNGDYADLDDVLAKCEEILNEEEEEEND
jgi:hypothetical protein